MPGLPRTRAPSSLFAASLVALSLVVFLRSAPLRAVEVSADSDLQSSEVQDALRESADGRFPEAKKKLAAILSSAASRPQDREVAEVEMARIEWRIDGKPDAARARLEALMAVAKKKSSPLLLLSRMERNLQRFAAARTAARRALDAAEKKNEREAAGTSLALALVDQEVRAAREGRGDPFEEAGRKRLLEALDLLAPGVHEAPGALTPSLTQLDAALLLDDGPHALEAWRSYFTAAGAADSTLLAGPRAILGDLLPRWLGPNAPREDREALVKALAESRLFTEAVLVAKNPRPPESGRVTHLTWVKDLVLYESYIQDLQETTDLFYRDVARGKAHTKAWRKDVKKKTEDLWKSLSWTGKIPPFDESLLDGKPDTALGDRFGAVIYLGRTSAAENLHMGHRVIDEKRTADQYGRHAAIRFVALDTMVSNGYETWMWDGHGAHGGWGDVGLIVQVRPEYVGGAVAVWEELTDAERRARADQRMADESARDEERAKKDPCTFLPGLAQRLRRQGSRHILDELHTRQVPDGALRGAFVAEFDRAIIESSIFAHEGRHAIDAEFEPSKQSETLEYRAKLSEIAFASVPRLAFAGILNSSIGNPTPHGQANLKLIKGLVSWMETHREEIDGLDRTRPLLPQLDKLTDEQLRSAARSLDPMAAQANAPRTTGE